jgi:hypothetical protein
MKRVVSTIIIGSTTPKQQRNVVHNMQETKMIHTTPAKIEKA